MKFLMVIEINKSYSSTYPIKARRRKSAFYFMQREERSFFYVNWIKLCTRFSAHFARPRVLFVDTEGVPFYSPFHCLHHHSAAERRCKLFCILSSQTNQLIGKGVVESVLRLFQSSLHARSKRADTIK